MKQHVKEPEEMLPRISINPGGVSVRYDDDPQTNQLFRDAVEQMGLEVDDRVLERARRNAGYDTGWDFGHGFSCFKNLRRWTEGG